MLTIQEFIMILTKKFPKSFYEDTITLMPKSDKDITKKELQDSIFDGYRCKTLQESISKLNPTTHTKDDQVGHHDQVGFISGSQGWFSICKSIDVIHHIIKRKD